MDDANALLAGQLNQLADSILGLDSGPDGVMPRYRRLSEAGRLTREALRRGLLPEVSGLTELAGWVEDPPEPPEPPRVGWWEPCDYNLWLQLAGFGGVIERAFPGLLAGRGELDVTKPEDLADMLAADNERWAVVLRWLASRVGEAGAGEPFVPTPLQRNILEALDGKAMTTTPLASKVCAGDARRLFKPGGIKELTEAGLVKNKRPIGYYRPDAPPKRAKWPLDGTN